LINFDFGVFALARADPAEPLDQSVLCNLGAG